MPFAWPFSNLPLCPICALNTRSRYTPRRGRQTSHQHHTWLHGVGGHSLTLGFTPFYTYPSSQNWTLDFEPAFSPRFCFLLSPRSLFPTAQRFPIQKHVTSGLGSLPVMWFPVTSGSGHVISGSGYDVILTSKRGSSCLVGGHYY